MAKYGVFLKPTTLDRMVVVKTTVASPADSDWASQDGEVDFKTKAVKSLWAYEDSSDIHIVTQQENGRVAYHLFDPGTDTWTIKNEKVAVAGDGDYDTAVTDPACSLAVRSNGNVIILFRGNDATKDNVLTLYSKRSGGSWGTPILVDDTTFTASNSGVIAVGPDSSDRITFAYSVGSGNGSINTRSLSSADALGTETVVNLAGDNAGITLALGVIDSSNKIYLPYIDEDNEISVADWASGATPTVNLATSIGDNTVYGHGRTAAPFVAACLAVDGTDVHLLYADDTTQDLFYDNDVDAGGTTDTEELDAVTVNRISCKKGTSDLLYFYDDGGTTKYGAITLVVVAPPTINLVMAPYTPT